MTRRPKAGGGTRKEPGRQGVKVKRKISTTHRKHPSARASRDLRELLKRRTAELTVAREQQIATADVLKVIASSPGEVGSALQAVVQSACKLCNAYDANVVLKIGDDLHYSAHHGPIPTGREPRPLSREWVTGRSVIDKMPVQVSDFRAPRAAEFPEGQRQSREQGHRCTLSVPLLRKSEAIGAIVLRRLEPVAFTDKQIKLLQIFADQAVIAIENVRLFNEMQEALERQTATADILKVIASSPSDVKPVFEAIAARAKSLVGGFSSTVFRFIDGVAHLEAFTPTSPEADDILRSTFPRPANDFAPFRMTQAGEVMQIPDTEALTDEILGISRARGFRSMVFAPLMNKGVSIGFIAVTRIQPGDFSDHHVQLLRTFADQAVIAIQNVRLFDEVQARTIDLSEALEQQTATAEVLGVISSSAGDLAPVFDAMLGKAMQLCSADFGVLNTYDGKAFHTAATYALPPAYDEFRRKQPMEYGPGTALVRLLQGEPVVEITDLIESEAYRSGEPNRRALVDIGGARCLLAVPLLKDERVVGNVMIFRQEKGRFSEKQILLLQQFAAQAVIAIENTRLLRELRQRTDDLTEALTYQTGSSDILKVIASSPTNLIPVLQAIVESVCELCGAYDAVVRLKRGNDLEFSAHHGNIPVTSKSLPVDRNSTAGLAVIEGKPVHVHDLLTKEGDAFLDAQHRARQFGHRTVLSVPLTRDGQSIGVIVLRRTQVHPFTDKQVALVQTFADQAVIAIDNAQLFQEVQARTSELSKSLEDLRAAQDRLIQTEKLASLGQLTAGIAHEIKNPLNFVNNFSALSSDLTDELNEVLKQERLTDNGRQEVNELTALLKDNLGKVVQHGKRADSIVKNMLMHSREGLGEHRLANINAIVEESLNLAYHGARAEKPGFNITLERELDPTVNDIELYPQEITRALINLISNGFYAATKRAGLAGSDFEPVLRAATRNVGDGVEIRIRDNGTGIPSDIKEKIFNPFFTTKPAGDGTGLGLSMSHDIIVKQHGGTIDVDTAPDAFTEFRIVLPRTGGFHIKPGERT
jgi:two-component system, NtrC family, sensor kinase